MIYTITTFDALQRWADAFTQPDGLRLLFIVGSPGHSKSYTFAHKIGEAHRYIKASRFTAFHLYKQIYAHLNKALVFDDVDDILKSDLGRKIIMNLCETDDDQRTVAWYGSESQLKVRRRKRLIPIPQEFKTSSRVCVICNDWDILTRNCAALLDRGNVIFFEPTPEETHRFVGTWFRDKEVYEFIGKHLSDISRHSIRYYTTSREDKRLGLPWQEILLESWSSEAPVQKSKRDEMDWDRQVAIRIYCEEQTTADRHRHWHDETGKGHSTFDSRVKDAKAAGLLGNHQAEVAAGKLGNWENPACQTGEELEAAEEMADIKAVIDNMLASAPS